MSASIAARLVCMFGLLAVSMRLAFLSLADEFMRGEVAIYYVAFFVLVSVRRSVKAWRTPLVSWARTVALILFGLYCIALAYLIGSQHGDIGSGKLSSSLFMGTASVCYFFLACWVLCGKFWPPASGRKAGFN